MTSDLNEVVNADILNASKALTPVLAHTSRATPSVDVSRNRSCTVAQPDATVDNQQSLTAQTTTQASVGPAIAQPLLVTGIHKLGSDLALSHEDLWICA